MIILYRDIATGLHYQSKMGLAVGKIDRFFPHILSVNAINYLRFKIVPRTSLKELK